MIQKEVTNKKQNKQFYLTAGSQYYIDVSGTDYESLYNFPAGYWITIEEVLQ